MNLISTSKNVYILKDNKWISVKEYGGNSRAFSRLDGKGESQYYRGRNDLFYYSKDNLIKIPNFDLDQLVFYHDDYLGDGRRVLYEGREVDMADSKTFSAFTGENDSMYYAYDKSYVYYKGIKLKNVSFKELSFLGSLKQFDTTFVRSLKYVYFRGDVVKDLSPDTVKIYKTQYMIRDDNNVTYKYVHDSELGGRLVRVSANNE